MSIHDRYTTSYPCLVPGCPRLFARPADLQRHYDTVHKSDAGQLFECPHKWCGRTGDRGFAREDHYRDHLREVHQQEGPRRSNRVPRSLQTARKSAPRPSSVPSTGSSVVKLRSRQVETATTSSGFKGTLTGAALHAANIQPSRSGSSRDSCQPCRNHANTCSRDLPTCQACARIGRTCVYPDDVAIPQILSDGPSNLPFSEERVHSEEQNLRPARSNHFTVQDASSRPDHAAQMSGTEDRSRRIRYPRTRFQSDHGKVESPEAEPVKPKIHNGAEDSEKENRETLEAFERHWNLENSKVPLRSIVAGYVETYAAADLSITERIKQDIEAYSGCPWDWWPLSDPKLKPRPGCKVVSYTCCGCKQTYYTEISDLLAAELKVYMRAIRSRPPASGQPTQTQQTSPTSMPMSGQTLLMQSQNSSMSSNRTRSTLFNQRPRVMNAPSQRNGSTLPATYQMGILLTFANIPPQFRVLKFTHGYRDASLMKDIKRNLRQMMGFYGLGYYLHWKGFGWCDFLEYRVLNKQYLEKIRKALPEDCDRKYVFDPRKPKADPPFDIQGWQVRYHVKGCMASSDLVVNQTPKLKHGYDFRDEEIAYGLDIRLRPIFLRIAIWHVVILAGPVGFWIYWLNSHEGDWQNATVPTMVVLALFEPLFVLSLGDRLTE